MRSYYYEQRLVYCFHSNLEDFNFLFLPPCTGQDLQYSVEQTYRSRCACFVPDLGDKAFSLPTLSTMCVMCFVVDTPHQLWEGSLLVLLCREGLNKKSVMDVGFCQMIFLHLLRGGVIFLSYLW